MEKVINPWLNDDDVDKRTVAKSIKSNLPTIKHLNVFVASFSGNGDLLSQWRAYCPTTGGFSLGLDGPPLKRILLRHRCHLAKCVYDDLEKRSLIHDLVVRSLEQYRLTGNHGWQGVAGEFTTQFVVLASLLKHNSFKEEDEYRTVPKIRNFDDEHVDFRVGTSTITPYLTIPLYHERKRFPLRKVIVGPTPHRELARQAVRGLLFKAGLIKDDGVLRTEDVVLSKTPYRTW